jgi:hypothetical protein
MLIRSCSRLHDDLSTIGTVQILLLQEA